MVVALLTLFNGLCTTYSLVNVVADHLKILLNHNMTVKLLVAEQCPLDDLQGIYSDPRIIWCKVTNSMDGHPIRWYDYASSTTPLHDTFSSELHVIASSLYDHLSDVDVCMMHDILFQGWHYIHNIAIRQVATKLPTLKFISFTHSFPLSRPQSPPPHLLGLYTPLKNTTYVYPTYSGIPALAHQYQVPQGRCKVVYNAFDRLDFLSPEVHQLHLAIDFYASDLLVIYPARLTPAKQHEKIIMLCGHIMKHCNLSVTILFCDFPCSDIDATSYKHTLKALASTYSLSEHNVFFTSDHGFPQGLPRRAVLDLFTLSNLFICPSYSESFGLTVLEAASSGNFLVLNRCVPALEELGEELHAYFMEWPAKIFEGEVTPNYHGSEASYYEKHAKKIGQLLISNPILRAKTLSRTQYNLNWIWHHQLQPLLSPIYKLSEHFD